MGSIFIVSGISLTNAIIRYVKLRRTDGSQREFHAVSDQRVMKTFLKVCLVYLIILLYAILFTEFGYVISTLLIPPVLLFVLGCRKWQYYIYVYAFATIIYMLFIYVLKVPMQ
jgi:cell division protein FtsW (lipid II flippase)